MIAEDTNDTRHSLEQMHREVRQSLSEEEELLLNLRDELYNGSWDEIYKDLRNRLKGKPYIFRLANRLEDDLKRIEKLKAYEEKHRINLADYT